MDTPWLVPMTDLMGTVTFGSVRVPSTILICDNEEPLRALVRATLGSDDYTILDTRGDAVTYDPERLSMERSSTAFTAEDRIGQLAVQINDITDARRMLARMGWSL